MKKLFSLIFLSLVLTACTGIGGNQNPENLKKPVVNTVVELPKNPLPAHSTIVVDTVDDFFKNNHRLDHYGKLLRKRLEQGEFSNLLNELYEVHNIRITEHYEVGISGQKMSVFFLDIVIKRETHFQWLQLKAYWDIENSFLINLENQPIDYWSRINREGEVKTATSFVENVLTNLQEISAEQFGWRYQGENQLISSSIDKVELSNITPMGYVFSEIGEMEEALLKVLYNVSFLENYHEVEAMIYVRRYDDKWQIEDIQVMETESVKGNKP